MKVFKKWLIYGLSNGKARIATSFHKKEDAIDALNSAGFKRLEDNLWEDRIGQRFFIEKNAKEYK